MANKSRRKGDRFEQQVVRLLKEAGFEAHRYGQGAQSGDLPADIHVEGIGHIECKHYATMFGKLYRWLDGPANVLAVKADRKEPLAVLPLSDYIELQKRAQGK